jgi:hypothetical protein
MSWFSVPPRPFPGLVWLETRYPFRLPPSVFAARASQPEGRRPFPAKVWLMQRQRLDN